MEEKFLRRRKVEGCRATRSTIYDRIKAGTFQNQSSWRPLGGLATSDIDAWQGDCITKGQ